MERVEEEALLKGQVEIWKYMFGFADSMALKCAVELQIADIINQHGHPITITQLASSIDSQKSLDITYLSRIMKLLVRRKIFATHNPSDGGETLYGLTHSSKWLIRDSEPNLVPMVIMQNHPLQLAPWHCLSQCVKEGGICFEKAHGMEMWDFASKNPMFNKMFNDAMACYAKIIMKAIMEGYKDGFGKIGSLVDVGGGTGGVIAEIVKAYPHIKGVNFDLPHVVATASKYEGVEHVGGDMFETIPNADVVFLKWVLHDWGDEDCVKILRNCREAIPEKQGKVIIIDHVLQPEGNGLFDDIGAIFDVLMFANTTGGRERTKLEWKKILEDGGFPCYKIIKLQAFPSIIEAYPA